MTGSEDPRGSGARTLLLLKCIAEGESEFTLKSLAEKLDLAPSTVHRLLQTLAAAELVERAPMQSYRIGPEFFRIASLVSGKHETGKMARPYLRALWNQWQETCAFGVYKHSSQAVMITEVIDTPHPLQYVIEPLTNLSLAWGSLGRAIMAYLPEDEFEDAYAASSVGPLTGRQPPSRSELFKELKKIRQRGYSIYEDRAHIDVAGVAAPVFEASGAIIGALGVMMPGYRFEKCSLSKLGASVSEQAQRLSETLGSGG